RCSAISRVPRNDSAGPHLPSAIHCSSTSFRFWRDCAQKPRRTRIRMMTTGPKRLIQSDICGDMALCHSPTGAAWQEDQNLSPQRTQRTQRKLFLTLVIPRSEATRNLLLANAIEKQVPRFARNDKPLSLPTRRCLRRDSLSVRAESVPVPLAKELRDRCIRLRQRRLIRQKHDAE